MSEYTQGVCNDGAVILKDGEPMTIEQILFELRNKTHWDLSTIEGREQAVIDNLPSELKSAIKD